MALYEGIALIQEKQAVVLDLGTEYTKFGFTGEPAPRCIIRSQFWCERERRQKRVHDYSSPDELYENLVQMLHVLYFRHVLVNPKERKVVVVESLLTPTLFRETLAKVLFIHYEVSGVVWADSARLCALPLGAPVVLVVDIGARDAEVVPVVHGSVVLRGLQAPPLGARAVLAELRRLVLLDNPADPDLDRDLSDHVVEDIKAKTCFVAPRTRAIQWDSESPPAPAKSVTVRVGERAVLVGGRSRELAAEVLFQRDYELASLPDAVLQCIMQCPIDTRRALAESVLVSGGGAVLPGLTARLAHELRYLLTQPPYSERLHIRTFKFHAPPGGAGAACAGSAAWVGGALLGAGGGDALAARALSRDVFVRARRLADWVCLLDNTPHAHHAHHDHM